NHAANVASIRNQTRAKSRLVARGSKRNCELLSRNCWLFSAQPPARRSSDRRFELRASAEKSFHRSSRPKSWPRFILRRFCASRTKNRDAANIKTSWRIFGSPLKQPTPIKASVSPTVSALGSQLSFPSAQVLQIL